MKKLLLLFVLLLIPSFVFSSIDECKIDVYFANGILTDEGNATANTILLKREIQKDVYNLDYKKYKRHIGKVQDAYNNTYGQIPDLAESLNQILNTTFGKPELFDSEIRKLFNLLVGLAHDADLEGQVDKYEASIKDGHKVLVVAHSQGNLFTKEAYDKLGERSNKDNWMQSYFDAVSIASPGYYPIKDKVERIDWDNDLVARLANFGKSDAKDIVSNVRKVHWEMEPYVTDENSTIVVQPTMNYVTKSDVNTMYKGRFKAIEGDTDKFDSNVHAFTFYMGKVIKDGDTGQVFVNPFSNKTMSDTSAKIEIMKAIKTKLGVLEKLDSQWIKDKEFDKNTCQHKITVKHRFDPSIEMGEKVYPFNASKKLYQAKNKAGALEYVKASCGGKNILDQWDGKKDNECLMIDNVEEEKIEAKQRFIRDDDKEVVLDTNTSLVWQDSVLVRKSWVTMENWNARDYMNTSGDTATTYCENLSLAGGGWRLPSIDELRSVNHSYSGETVQQIRNSFWHFASDYYWSSTSDPNHIYYAWIIHLYFEKHYSSKHYSYSSKHNYRYVRCVRAGQ